MNPKSVLVITVIFFLMLFFNFLMPLSYGDDYFYAFVYENTFWQPLSENARRLSSFSDVFTSFYHHYLTHSGRIIFILMFLFEWIGKFWFNFFNAGIATLLVLEVCWIADHGKISLPKPSRLCWVFFALWIFTPGWSTIFLWLGGSLNYLWTTVMLLGFIIPFVRKYFGVENPKYPPMLIFLAGIVAGCTNENTVCFFILFLVAQCILDRGDGKIEKWQIAGVIGLIIGYILLMASPGNFVRIETEHEISQTVREADDPTIATPIPFGTIMIWQSCLWIYLIGNLLRFKSREHENSILNHELNLVRALAFIWIFSILIMFFSPGFPPRSMFPGMVYLLIADTILIRLRNDFEGDQLKLFPVKCLHVLGVLFFIITLGFSVYGMNQLHEYSVRIDSLANSADKNEILYIDSFNVSSEISLASGIRIPGLTLSRSDKTWANTAFARYYGIKGVRAVDGKDGIL